MIFTNDIRKLGDRLAALSSAEAQQLLDYLATMGVKPPHVWDKFPNGFPFGAGRQYTG